MSIEPRPFHVPTAIADFKRLDVHVEVRDDMTDYLVTEYDTNLANDGERRVFAEQMLNAYSGGQYSIVSPLKVIRRSSA